MTARSIMLQGTGSSVGKSLLVAGLARACLRRGLRVRPFKPQNMSNNAAVTGGGGEIGRAQALQARAAGVAPSVHMNPVLLKPQSENGSQVVVQGRVHATARAREYQAMKPGLMPHVLDSFARMQAEADIVLVEGAGSASEVNLRQGDIANMGFARATGTPVVVVGDIERGGVIASLVGTGGPRPMAAPYTHQLRTHGPLRFVDFYCPRIEQKGRCRANGDVQVTLIKDGDHRLSRPADLALLLGLLRPFLSQGCGQTLPVAGVTPA